MREDIERIKKTADDLGGIFFMWHGLYYNTEDSLVKANRLFLTCLFKNDNTWTVCRIPGFCVKKPQPHVLFGRTAVYRVRSGDRRGKLVTARELFPEEIYEPAGLHKKLQYGHKPWLIHQKRKGDRDLLYWLRRIVDKDFVTVSDMEDAVPEIWLTTPNNGSRPMSRRKGSTMQYLMSMPGFDENISQEENLENLLPSICMDAGNDRVGYPYKHFFGKGVVAVSAMSETMSFGTWYRYHKSTPFRFELPHLEIEL